MEINNSPDSNRETLDFPKGKVEITNGSARAVFLKVRCNPENVGDVLEEVVKVVLTQDAKIRSFDERNTADYIKMNSSFVKENLDEILGDDKYKTPMGDSVRLSGKPLSDGFYEVVLITNMDDRVLPSGNGDFSFKEWFLNAVKGYDK